MAAIIIHLLACLMPLVFTRFIARKLIKVPNTGSTVLCRSFFILRAQELFSRSCILSQQGLSAVSRILFSKDLPMQVDRSGQSAQSFLELRYSRIVQPLLTFIFLNTIFLFSTQVQWSPSLWQVNPSRSYLYCPKLGMQPVMLFCSKTLSAAPLL